MEVHRELRPVFGRQMRRGRHRLYQDVLAGRGQIGGMDKQELGEFLRSRRERRPEDIGLPSGSRRRTPGLRRDEVAVLAHISTDYYVRLEQGRADPEVAGLVQELRKTSSDFARLWERHDVQAAPMLTKTFSHPVVGDVIVGCDSLMLSDRKQHLVLYSVPAGSHEAEALSLLSVLGTDTAHYLT
jgi:hypothetical protein